MKSYILENGNFLRIENECFFDNKIRFDIVHIQKDGYWKHRETQTINLSFYFGVQDYIKTNYKVKEDEDYLN